MKHRHAHSPMRLVLVAAIAALVGCQNTPPTTKTEVIAPIPFAGGNQDADAQPIELSGQAMLGDTPLADAQVRVYDIMTNEEAKVIAPGGGNVISAGGLNLKTDAQGRFSVKLAGLAPGQVVRVAASRDGQTLATLVSGDGETLNGTRSVQSLRNDFLMNLASTMLTAMAEDGLKLTKTLTPRAASDIVKQYFAELKAKWPVYNSYIIANSAIAQRILAGYDPQTGTLTDDAHSAVSTALTSTGELQAWLDLNRSTIEEILDLIKTRNNLSPELAKRLGSLKSVRIPGTDLTVSFDERYLTVVRAEARDASGAVTRPAKTVRIDVTNYGEIQTVVASGEFSDLFKVLESLKQQAGL